MDTMEITKIVGASCGALLLFLVINTGAEAIYHSGGHGGGHGDDHGMAYPIEVEVASAADEDAEPVVEVAFGELYAVADAAAGEKLFRACASCHKLEAGSNAVGPYLHGVVGRDIASASGFDKYSSSLEEAEGNWDPEVLQAFLENPKGFASNTVMAYRGMKDPVDRANLIAYLATFN